ncbi:MAG: CoB--CoM heterodisulfide reductase iron-sulfur subunit B family protein [Deltaproteobacteria bacterium]|nr:CoB--CoM heterodisulfide reductase iron-sulfur subunit B family protein [Deltaproteobacteria bacterium]MBW2066388.1 CoB--CoM heterodisulfide reductase iron-sulfur subunit B family protein [Deltaproteobacteria bacterium]
MSGQGTYLLFLGCTIPARARNYELSARKVAERLGLELLDMEDFMCCGFPLKGGDPKLSNILGAYNLAIGEREGLGLCTLCSSCASALTETAFHLSKDRRGREEINRVLRKAGLQYGGGVKVRHYARILYEEVGLERIKTELTRGLEGLRIAIHYGCHYLKPSEIYEGFDDPEDPQTLDALVSITGATVADYKGKKSCCGGPVLPVDEKTALSVAKGKLDNLIEAGADALCLVCPFCSVMFDSNQKSIEAEFEAEYKLPVLYLPQLLGLAMGMDRKELGLNMNVVKTKDLLLSLGLDS